MKIFDKNLMIIVPTFSLKLKIQLFLIPIQICGIKMKVNCVSGKILTSMEFFCRVAMVFR